MRLDQIKAIDFIGIGGIGMSAIARYFHARGIKVSGYDKTETVLTRKLADAGMAVRYHENVATLPSNIDLVVYTPAVPDHHSELQYYRANNYPVLKRSAVLGIISKAMKCLAVAGTHGKTTTTTLTTFLAQAGGVDVSAFLGGISRDFGSNFVEGQSDWVVVEADEYDRSFLQLEPTYAAITSLDADHLDIYGDRETMLETGFRAFAKKIKEGGELLVLDGLEAELGYQDSINTFGIDRGDYRAERLRVEEGFFVFDYYWPGGMLEQFRLPMPGRHNVLNTIAALSLSLLAGADPVAMRKALPHFLGIGRRFEFVLREKDRVLIDDYAHHPTELKAAIGAAKMLYPGRRISGLFQPHLYSRTRDFAEGFAAALDELDEAWLLPIYPAREEPIEGVRTEMILEMMKNPNRRLVQKEEVVSLLAETRPEVMLSLGAGDIDTIVPKMKEELNNQVER